MAICTTKQRPRRDPKFHQEEILVGAGISTKALFTTLINGSVLRKFIFIALSKASLAYKDRILVKLLVLYYIVVMFM